MRRAPAQAGFTLIEVMIVVVILGILASIVVPRIMGRPDEARLVKVHTDIRAIASALELYRLDNFRYPSTVQGLEALVSRPSAPPLPPAWKAGGYLERLPLDPWGNPYQYLQPGLHGSFDLYSFGADGRPSGEGLDADVGNWSLD